MPVRQRRLPRRDGRDARHGDQPPRPRVEVSADSDVITPVADGDADALQVLRQSGREIGGVLVSAVGLLSPAHLVSDLER